MKNTQKILIWILIALVILQGIQSIYHVINVKKLAGVVHEPEKPHLTLSSWLDGKYQDQVDDYINHHFGFRPDFIRLYNQLQYSLYGEAHGTGVVFGKQNYLFEEDYIKAYYGYDFSGDEKIRENLKKLETIQSFLQQQQTELLIVLAPGKPYYYPGHIPEKYEPSGSPSNYSVYRKLLEKTAIPVFDVNEWFEELKDQIEPPLFTQTGIHWSVYGSRLVADSLIKYSGELLNKPMNQVHITGYEWSKKMQNSDNDLEKLLNLFFRINKQRAAYPTVEKERSIPPDQRPSMIVIADSFFWLLFDGILGDAYRSVDYWYYYSSIFSQNFDPDTKISDVCVPCQVEQKDIVVIIMTTASLKNFGFGFIDDFYPYTQPNAKHALDSLTNRYVKIIQQDSSWMEMIRQKAEDKNISADSMLMNDARYMAKKELSEAKTN